MFDERDRKWLYEKMQRAGVNTGTYDEFKSSLGNQEDIDWYYNKSRELGLNVGTADNFRSMMVEQPSQQQATSKQPAQPQATQQKPVQQTQTQSQSNGQHVADGKPAAPYKGSVFVPYKASIFQQPEEQKPQESDALTWNSSAAQRLRKFDLASEQAWDAAEQRTRQANERAAESVYGGSPSTLGGREMHMMNASALTHAKQTNNLREHDLDRLFDDAWNNLGEQGQAQAIEEEYSSLKEKYPDAEEEALRQASQEMARQRSNEHMYDMAVQKNMPKNNLEYLGRKIIEGNSVMKLTQAIARSSAGTTGDWKAREAAEQQYKKNGGGGAKATNIAGSVLGIAIDPVTWVSAGMGGLAVKGSTALGGKIVGDVAMRKFGTTLGGRLTMGAIGGAANFATFEGLGEGVEQLKWGGARDEKGNVTGYDMGTVGGRMLHGLGMGATVGLVSPLVGNVSTNLVRNTGSTAGKMGIRAGELAVGTIAEGTIFGIPDMIQAAQNGESVMDAWTESMLMIGGFKLHGMAKSAPKRIAELKGSPEAREGFETRLRNALDGKQGMALTKDESEELKKNGYGDLSELVEEYNNHQGNTARNAEAQRTGRLQIEAGEGAELPYNRFEELMNDGNISEAARAKMYYYITGNVLPMSTVMGSTYTEHKDEAGNVTGYTVRSVGANGVITSRSFEKKTHADAEVERINRQAELNAIEIGERYYNNKGEQEQMREACRLFGEEMEVSPELLYRMMQREPEEMTQMEKEWAERINEKYEELGDQYSADAMRAEIGDEYGVDVDKAIAKEPNRRSEDEQAALEEYARRLYPEDTMRAEREQEESPAQQGYDANEQERRDIVLRNTIENNPEDGQEAWNGAHQRIEDEADLMVAEKREAYRKQQHDDDKSVRLVHLKLEDGDFYVVSGDVVMTEDWAAVDVENSSASVVVYDPKTGERKMVSTKDIRDAYPHVSLEQQEKELGNEREKYVQEQMDKAHGKVRLAPGEKVALPEGGEAVVLAVSESDVTVQMPDGKQQSIPLDVLQEAADAVALADYLQRHPESAETMDAQTEGASLDGEVPAGQAASVSGNVRVVEGAPEVYSEGMELTVKDRDGNEKPAMVMRMVRYKNGEYVPDESGKIVEFMMDGEVFHENVSYLNDFVVSHNVPVEEAKPAEDAPVENAPVENAPVEAAPATEAVPEQSEAQRANGEYSAKYGEKWGSKLESTVKDRAAEVEKKAKALAKAQESYDNAPIGKEDKAEAALAKAKQEYDVAVAEKQKWDDIKAEHDKVVAEQLMAEAAAREEERKRREAADAAAHDEAVARQQAEYEERKRKEAERKAAGVENAMPNIIEKWDTADKVDGSKDVMVLPNGELIKGHYVLHEAGASSPSHDSHTWAKTEGYPMDENGGSVNDRDYEHDKDAQAFTKTASENFDIRALQKMVVVSSDGVVLSGNGRTIAGELAAEAGTDGAYIDYLKEYAHKYGFTPEQVLAMQHPRVSFVPDERMPYTAETFAKFNAQEEKSQSKTESAVKLGKTVGDEVFGKIVNSINRHDTLGDFYNDANDGGLASIGLLREAGVIPDAQMAEMKDGDSLSAIGKQMLENILIGKAFAGNPDAVRMLSEVPSMRQSVVYALAAISDNVALGEDWTLQSQLTDAVKLCYEARSHGFKHGEMVSGYARQGVLFADPDQLQTAADLNNEAVLMLADVLNHAQVSKLKKVLEQYNKEARVSMDGQADIFGGGVRTREEILRETIKYINNANRKELERAESEASERRKRASLEAAEPAGKGGAESERGGGDGGERGSVAHQVSSENIQKTIDPRQMSDEEKRRRGDMLRSAPVVDVKEGVIVSTETMSARKAAEKWWDENVPEPVFYGTEAGEVEINRNSVQSSLAHRYSQAKLDALTSLVDGFENAVYLGTMPDFTRQDDILEHYFAYPIEYHGERCYVFCRAMQDANKNRLYVHEVFVADNIKKGETLQTAASQLHGGISLYKDILANVLGNIQTEASKPNGVIETGGKGTQNSATEDKKEHEASQSAEGEAEENSPEAQDGARNGDVAEGENGNLTPAQQAVEAAREEVETNPTEGQKKAGNYKMGHVSIDGFDVSIENPKGSVRRGKDANGKEWENKMNNDYGYIRGTEGVDGDHIDVFLSDKPDEGDVFVVDQYNEDGTFDEHKVMYGYQDAESAMADYLANYSSGWENSRRLDISHVSKDEFKKWVASSHRKTKPFAEYSSVKKAEGAQYVSEKDVMQAVESGDAEAIAKVKEALVAWSEQSLKREEASGGSAARTAAFTLMIVDRGLRKYDGSQPVKHATMEIFRDALQEFMNRHGLEVYREGKDVRVGDAVVIGDEIWDVVSVGDKDFTAVYDPNNENDDKKFSKERKNFLGVHEVASSGKRRGSGGAVQKHTGDGVASKERRALGVALVEHLREAGVEVSTDWEEGRRVLEAEAEKVQRMSVEEASRRFDAQLDAFEKGVMPSNEQLSLGTPGAILQAAGVPSKELKIKQSVLRKHLAKHGLKVSDIRGLASAVQNPIMVYDWGSNAKSHVVVTDLTTADGRKIAVAIKVEADGSVQEVNEVSSVHGKDAQYFLNGMSNAKSGGLSEALRYVEKEKALAWLTQTPPKGASSSEQGLNSAAKVLKDFENPEISPKILQKMTVWHGSPHYISGGFDHSKINTGQGAQSHGWGTYVAKNKEIGEDYARYMAQPRNGIVVRFVGDKSKFDNTLYGRDVIMDIEGMMRRGMTFEEAVANGRRLWNNTKFEYSHREKRKVLDALQKEDFETDRHLYEVEIPEDNGSNYIDEQDRLTDEQIVAINNSISSYIQQHGGDPNAGFGFIEGIKPSWVDGYNSFYYQLQNIEKAINPYTKEPKKDASGILYDAGFVGIKYDGRQDGECYVIFDEKDAKIVNHTQFWKTGDGEVYGFVKDGKVYLDPERLDPETPVHEYSHLWDDAVRRTNPELWKRGVELMKQLDGGRLWDEVVNDPNYADIADDEDMVASEVKSRLAGEDGARLLERAAQETLEGSYDAIEKAERISIIERVKEWLREAWAATKEWLRGKSAFADKWSREELDALTAEDFAQMTMRDLMDGVNPREEARKVKQADVIQKTNPAEDDYHTWIRSPRDAKSFREILREAEANNAENGALTYPDMSIDDLRKASESGYITVYSSKPIKDGVFVTPSKMNASDYAGGGKVYSKRVPIDDVAWISEDEGQMAMASSETEQLIEEVKEKIGPRLTSKNYDLIKKINPLVELIEGRKYPANLPYRDVFKEPTLDDYYIATTAEFKNVGRKSGSRSYEDMSLAEQENERMWEEMKSSGKYEHKKSPQSNSEYLIDRGTGDIYRLSDHWGRVASCDWEIDRFDAYEGGSGCYQIGKANIKDFGAKSTHNYVAENPEFAPRALESLNRTIANYEALLASDVEITASARKRVEESLSDYRDLLEKYKKEGGFGDINRGNLQFSIKDIQKLNYDVAGKQVEKEDGLREAEDMERRYKELQGTEEHKRMVEAAKRIKDMEPIPVPKHNMSREEQKATYIGFKNTTNKETGISVEFFSSAFEKNHREGGLFEKAIPALKEAFENAVLAYSERENLAGKKRADGTEHKEHRSIRSYDNYVGKVNIGGKEYYVRFTVQVQPGQNGIHSQMVTNVKLYETENPIKVASYRALSAPARLDFDEISDAKLQRFFDLATENEKDFAKALKERTGWERDERGEWRYEEADGVGISENGVAFREVEDGETMRELESGETVKVYRAMQLIDGKLYPPMAAVVDGKLVQPTEVGRWYQSDERPELVDKNGNFKLNKGQGKGVVPAAYNPYFHTSFSPLNDQFSSAYTRPNLVIVECEVPKSELTSGYKAKGAKDAVGEMSWHSGAVSGALAKAGSPRRVVLSRYAKVNRVLTNAEVADVAAGKLKEAEIAVPYNVVTPQLAEELKKRGVTISDKASGTVGKSADYGKAEYVTDEKIEAFNANSSVEGKRERVSALGEALHTEIEVVEDVNTITHNDPKVQERMRKSKGYYNQKSGKVVVVLPNNSNVEDVAATVFHEVVAHKGLRELVGDEAYGEFLGEVYGHCTEEVRRRIAEKANKHGWDFTKATDEYLGELAEKGFEDFTEGERSIWQKLKQKVLDVINKFLKSLKLPQWVKLGDNELRYMLWRSHENLRRGKEDVIQTAQDIVKRGELGLSEDSRAREGLFRMGDKKDFKERQREAEANRGTVMPGLNEAEVKVVDVPRHNYTGSAVEAKNQAMADAEERYRGKTLHYDNHGAQFDYVISGESISKSMSRKAIDKSANIGAHLAVLNHLDKVIGESIEVEEHPDYHKDKVSGERGNAGIDQRILVHRFYGAISIDGEVYRVKTTMKELLDGKNSQYTYEVINAELLPSRESSSPDGVLTMNESMTNAAKVQTISGTEKENIAINAKRAESERNNFSQSGGGEVVKVAELLRNLKKSHDEIAAFAA